MPKRLSAKSGFLFAGSALALSSAVQASAQEVVDEAAPAQAEDTNVIVVTAQRRAEDIQDVPAAVTALTAAQLVNRQISDANDLQVQIPGVVISTGTGTSSSARIFFRGVGEDESRGAIDPAVGVYIDGVYLGRTVGSLVDLVDVEQVEVLRGPQGTLYGRNTVGGAIKFTSVLPEYDYYSLEGEVGFGSDSRFSTKATLNAGLTESTALRVSALYKERDGFFELNPTGDLTGQGDQNLGEEDVFALRASLRQQISDDWSALFTFDRAFDRTEPTPSSIAPQNVNSRPGVANDADNNLFTVEPAPGVDCVGAVPQIFQQIGCFLNYDSRVETTGLSLKVDGSIGTFDVSSITAYRELNDALSTHIGFPFSQTTNQDQFSQELLLSSNFDGPLNFVAGAYYFDESVQLDSIFFFPFSVNVQTESFALFSQATYDLTEQLSLTGGLRWTTEDRVVDSTSGAPGLGTLTFPLSNELDTDNITWTAKVDYSFTDDILVYASYATGFKSPGVSPDCFSAAACFLPVNEEQLDSFEVGLRSEFWDGRAQFNATYFYNQYEDLQISATLPTGGFTRSNAGEAQIQGVEIETNFKPIDGLTIYAHASWLDAEYRNLTAFQAGILSGSNIDAAGNVTVLGPACPAGATPSEASLIDCALGLDLKNAPELKGTIGFNYETDIGAGALFFGGDVAYEDDSFGLVANVPGSVLEPGTRIDARIGYKLDNWRITLWGKNLTDREYARASTGTNQLFAAPPMTWGIDIGFSFD